MTPHNSGTRTHKVSGWTRTPLRDMSSKWSIQPSDDSGERIVRFQSAHSWANDPNDDRARIEEDRVILISGEPLPLWAKEWLHTANRKSCQQSRDAFHAAMDDMNDRDFRDSGW